MHILTFFVNFFFFPLLQNECLSALYIIQKGQVRLTYNPEQLNSTACSLLCAHLESGDHSQNNNEHIVEMSEGNHFGEWALLGECVSFITAVSIGEVVCTVITKENFDSTVGPLPKVLLEDRKYGLHYFRYIIFCIYISTLN